MPDLCCTRVRKYTVSDAVMWSLSVNRQNAAVIRCWPGISVTCIQVSIFTFMETPSRLYCTFASCRIDSDLHMWLVCTCLFWICDRPCHPHWKHPADNHTFSLPHMVNFMIRAWLSSEGVKNGVEKMNVKLTVKYCFNCFTPVACLSPVVCMPWCILSLSDLSVSQKFSFCQALFYSVQVFPNLLVFSVLVCFVILHMCWLVEEDIMFFM